MVGVNLMVVEGKSLYSRTNVKYLSKVNSLLLKLFFLEVIMTYIAIHWTIME